MARDIVSVPAQHAGTEKSFIEEQPAEKTGAASAGIRGLARNDVLAIIGMALFWPLLRRNVLFHVLGGHDASLTGMTPLFCLYLACLTALVVLVVYRCKHNRDITLNNRNALIAIFSAQALLKVISCTLQLEGVVATIAAVADALLFPAVFVSLTLLWASYVCKLSLSRAAIVSVGGFILSFLIQQIGWLPRPVPEIITAFLPVISLGILVILNEIAGSGKIAAENTAATSVETPTSFTWHSDRAIIVLMLSLLASSVLRGVVNGGVDSALASPPLTQDILSIVYSGIFLGFMATPVAHKRKLSMIWPLTMVVLFAGILLMMLFGSGHDSLGSAIMMMGRTCLSVLLWLLLVGEVHQTHVNPIFVFSCCFLGCDILSSLLGYLIVPALVSLAGIDAANLAPALAAGMALVMMAASVFAFTAPAFAEKTGSSDSTPSVPGIPDTSASDKSSLPQTDPLQHNLDSISATYFLTEKESEVAALLAAGNSQKRIAEELGISIGTVQTHLKNIYRKLNIHTRQELIDLVRQP